MNKSDALNGAAVIMVHDGAEENEECMKHEM
jgi:hypothetical protein